MGLGWVCFNLPIFAIPIVGTYLVVVLITIAWFQISAASHRAQERRAAKRAAEEAEKAAARARAEADAAKKRQARESEVPVKGHFRSGLGILKVVGSTLAASELSRAKSILQRGRRALKRKSPSEIITEEASQLFDYAEVQIAFFWQRAFSESKVRSPLLIVYLSEGKVFDSVLDGSNAELMKRPGTTREVLPLMLLAERIRNRIPLFRSAIVLPIIGATSVIRRNQYVLDSFLSMSKAGSSDVKGMLDRAWLPAYSSLWSIAGSNNVYATLEDVINDLETRSDDQVWSESVPEFDDFKATFAASSDRTVSKDASPASQGSPKTIDDRDALEKKLQETIVGQRAAISAIATAVITYKRKINAARSPLVLMLPGPTGTGKTEITRALAAAVNGEFVRFDMGEFSSEHTATNLFGSPIGYHGSEKGGKLANAVRNTREGKSLIILFDEVEKAHPSIWQSSLAFFDEGRVTDSRGLVQAPHPTILVMTTNKAAQRIADDPENAKDILKESGAFSDEFMGRVKRVVPMLRLSEVERQILVERMVSGLAVEFGLSVVSDADAIVLLSSQITEADYSSGGRGVRDKIEDILNLHFASFADTGQSGAKLTVNSAGQLAVIH